MTTCGNTTWTGHSCNGTTRDDGTCSNQSNHESRGQQTTTTEMSRR